MSERKFTVVKVTVEQTYLIPMGRGQRTLINGWTVAQVIKDWFKRWPINSYHATRDGYRVGGGDKIIKIEREKLK